MGRKIWRKSGSYQCNWGVLFDTVTRKTVPIGFGVMSVDEVMERIFMLTNSKVGSDF